MPGKAKQPATDIRIGTLVSAGMKAPDYIRQILRKTQKYEKGKDTEP